jgi:hypothetical protein
MAEALTGLSALLQGKIEKLELTRNMLKGTGINMPDDELKELRKELERELTSQRVVLLATYHQVQSKGDKLNKELRDRLKFLSKKFAATILMEEWCEGCGDSLASELASGDLSIEYKDVGTPRLPESQTLAFPPTNHPAHDGTLGPCEEGPSLNEYAPFEKQENREIRMTQNIVCTMKDHKVGLFVVGLAHLHSMMARLRDEGFNVSGYSWIG